MMNAYEKALEYAGMTLGTKTITALGNECYEATTETKRGTLHILCGMNGTARIDKPNGTHKWVYEKSPAKIAALIRQTIEYNNY